MTPYADEAQYRVYDGLAADGSEDPDDLARGLIRASRVLDNKPQVQAKFVLDSFPDLDTVPYRDACCEIVIYWTAIGGGHRVDLSQNTLRPKGLRYNRVQSVSISQYVDFPPVAIEVLRTAGLWFPNPNTILEKVRRLEE